MFVRKKVSPYVVALYQQAVKEDALKEVLADAMSLKTLLLDALDVQSFLGTPFVLDEEKIQFLIQSHSQALSPLMVSFMTVVAQSRRMSILSDILSTFIDYAEFQTGVQSIHVTSAFSLSPDMESRLTQQLSKQLSAPVHMTVDVDPELIGGLIIQYPNYELDMSVRHKISTLQSTIKEIVA